MDQEQWKKHMQYLIYKGLVPKSRKNTANDQIPINAQAYEYILKHFDIRGRFNVHSDFVNHFNFTTEASIGKSGDFVKIKKGSFEIRLGNPKKIKVDGSIYRGSYYLAFRFMRIKCKKRLE